MPKVRSALALLVTVGVLLDADCVMRLAETGNEVAIATSAPVGIGVLVAGLWIIWTIFYLLID